MDQAQQHLVTILSQPVALLVSILWLLGAVIFMTWWVTRRVSRFATWQGTAEMIQAVQEEIEKKQKEHKEDDLRMFEDMAGRYQKGMEMASEKFVDGMKLTGDYLRKVTEEQQVIRTGSDRTSGDLHEIKGAMRYLLPAHVAKKIFKEEGT